MMNTFDPQSWVHTLRRRAKTFVGARPRLFFPLFRPRPAFDDLLVTRSTDLCIEGFPRSANSFAVGAVRHAQPGLVQIAHHTHVPANAMRACDWSIPTVVLIRSPQDAIVSRVALGKETRMVGDESNPPKQHVSFATWVHAWYSFYRSLSRYRKREQLLVAPFQHVIQDMGRVIERVNARFGTGLNPFSHSDEAVAAVQEQQGYHAGPNDRRAQLKKETRADFAAALRKEATLREWMDEAERLQNLYLEAVDGE
jgi:hypothetical protein